MKSFILKTFHLLFALISPLLWIQITQAEISVQDKLTVQEVVQMALEKNLDLKIQEQGLGMARGELLKAKVFSNPELEWQVENDALLSNEGEGSFSIGLGQTFFIGPKRRFRIGIAELNIGGTEKVIENTRRLLIAQAKEAFYAVLLLQEKLRLAEELIEINQRLVRLTEGRFREGFAPELDVGLSRIQLEQSRRDRMEIEKDLSVARANLNLLLGRPAQTSLEAQGPFTDREIDLDLSRLKQTALMRRADLKGQEVSLSIAGREIDLARADRIPDVTLSLDYTQERSIFSELNFSDRDRLAGLKLSLPIPFFNRNQGEIVQARVRQERAFLELDLLRAVIEKEMTNAATRVQVTHRTFKLFRDGILPLTEDHFRLTEAAYAQGQAGILNVMEAQRRFSEARLGYLEALFEYNLALTEIERVVGTSLTHP